MAGEVELDVLRFTWTEEVTMLARVGVAAAGGAVIGWERRRSGKDTGMRTLMLVSMGAALFTLVSIFGFEGHDQSRVAAQVVSGVGFLGAGAILRRGRSVRGLTTAAAIWLAAAVGTAAGVGLYLVAGATALLAVFVMGLWPEVEPADGPDERHPPADDGDAEAEESSAASASR